jgi:glycosyltransferase involved in cell wall biosynthesis
LRVLHIIEATIGGTRRHVADVCSGLAARGVDVTLVAAVEREPAFRGDVEDLRRRGVEVLELPMVRQVRPALDYAHLRALAAILRQRRPSIVHTHSSKAGVLGRLASAACEIGARVHTPHTFAFLFEAEFGPLSRRLYREIERQLAGTTQRMIAVSDDEAASFERAGFVPRERVRVVPNGIDPRPWAEAAPLERAELGIPAGVPLAAVIGLLNRAKGQDVALDALARPGLEALHLAVAGDGEMRAELAALARSLGVSGRVHFLGWRRDVPRLVAASDFVVLPSRWEALPYVLLEALAAARPVVSSDVDGARGLVARSGCGFLAPAGSADGLAAALRGMLALAPDERRRLGERGREAVLARHTAGRMLDGLLATYAELA